MTLAWPNLRRWIATLCVALLAFVLVEDAFAMDDPCHSAGAVTYNIALLDSAGAGDSEPAGGAPVNAGHQHHCCGAHATGLAAANIDTPLMAAPSRLGPAYSDQRGPLGDPNGLDRPPKTSALV